MNPAYFVRNYAEADYLEMVSLWESLGLGGAHRGDDHTVINRTLQLGGRLLLLIEQHSGAIVGTSWLTIDGRRTYIHHFGIDKRCQGKGLSKTLLRESLQVAKTIGLQVKLEVHRDNARAIALYTKSGFASLGDYQVYIIRDISSV
jgi:ribosomal protein S18 acetylase RimI-like enzyme